MSKPQASLANCGALTPCCRLVQSHPVGKPACHTSIGIFAPTLANFPQPGTASLLTQAGSLWGPSGRARLEGTQGIRGTQARDLEESCLTPQVVMTGSLNTLQHSWQHSFTDGCSANTSGSWREEGAGQRAQELIQMQV